MKNRNIFLLLLTAFLLVFGLLYYTKKPNEFLAKSVRKIVTLNPVKIIQTNTENYKIRIFNNNIYTLDFDSNRIYQYNLNGIIKKGFSVISSNKQNSPLIIDFDIDSTETIRIADTKNHQFISIINNKQSNEKSQVLFSRAKYVGNGQFLCKALDSSISNDEVLLLGKKKKAVFSQILPRYNDGGMATDGIFVNNKSSYVHISYHMGDIVVWKKNENNPFRFNTIDNYNIRPQVTSSSPGHFALKGDSKIINICGAVNDSTIFILSNVRSKEENKSDFKNNNVVDLYNISNGKYLKSYYLPKLDDSSIVDFIINKNQLYTIQGKKIAVYDLIN